MVKIDLITGFLGAGKTTFLKKYAAYCLEQGLNIGILENDYGAVNVDMMLLQDLMGENCELEMVAGGCDKDCHKRRFKTKLISMGMCGYDRVIVEPSGIFDVDEFFDTLHEEPLDRWYEIGNVFTIVDAKLEKDLSEAPEFLLASQIANAGKVIISKLDEVKEEEIAELETRLEMALQQIQCKRNLEGAVIKKDFKSFSGEDWEALMCAGYVKENYVKQQLEEENAFSSLYYMNVQITKEELVDRAKKLLEDKECGKVFRMKGFMQLSDGIWIELNATKQNLTVEEISRGQNVIIVIGEDLNESRIEKYWS